MIKSTDLDLSAFEKAITSLDIATHLEKDDISRDATIQRFEYTFELSWKMLKRYFDMYSEKQSFNIKELFREAGKQGLIDDVEAWFSYHQARNLTSHTYNETTANETYEYALKFAQDVKKLLSRLKEKIAQ